MSKNNKIPNYISELMKNNPKIKSGRKNYNLHHLRIVKTLKMIKEYFNIKN